MFRYSFANAIVSFSTPNKRSSGSLILKPIRLIIADTIKGKGVSYMEDKCGWHGKAPNKDEYEKAMAELMGGK